MATIVTREGKGSALTWSEADGNFTNLNTDKLEAADLHAATAKATPVDGDEIPLLDSAASFGLKKTLWSSIKATLKSYFDTLYIPIGGAGTGDASTNTATSVDSEVTLFSGTTGKLLKRATITGLAKLTSGVLSAASAGTDYAGISNTQSFSAGQRGTVVTADSASYDMNAGNNFITTLGAGQTMAFSNISAGQSGNIVLVNGTNYAVTKGANTYIKCTSTFFTTISATGTYRISYYSPNGTDVYVGTDGAVT